MGLAEGANRGEGGHQDRILRCNLVNGISVIAFLYPFLLDSLVSMVVVEDFKLVPVHARVGA